MISNTETTVINRNYPKSEFNQIPKKITPLDFEHTNESKSEGVEVTYEFKDIKWIKVFEFAAIHIIALYGLFTFPYIERYKTTLWSVVVYFYSVFGLTAGAHRYWSHRSFKAKMPLQILLAFCHLSAHMMKLNKWVTYHRIHHKFTETNADPHNSNRGLFFCHFGWMLIKKHPDVLKKIETIDVSDMKKDTVANFVDRYFEILTALTVIISVVPPVLFWNEEWYYACMIQIIRFVISVNVACSINSVAHAWGYKPYNRDTSATENSALSFVTNGESWHNYHHAFPYDYRMSEIGGFTKYDITSIIIRFFERIGWAYNLRKPSDSFIKKTIEKKGDPNLYTILAAEKNTTTQDNDAFN